MLQDILKVLLSLPEAVRTEILALLNAIASGGDVNAQLEKAERAAIAAGVEAAADTVVDQALKGDV